MTHEKIVQNSIIKYFKSLELKGHPIFYERRQAGGFSYHMGISDLYAVYDGYHIEIEVKAPTKTLRPMQEKWKEKCNALGIYYICADNIQIVKDKMKEWFNVYD